MIKTTSITRRRLLVGMSVTGMITIAGCSDGNESQADIKDSDGDGVIDSEDYAPQDPDVQEKSDLQGTQTETETPTQTETETPTQTETETPTQTETETETREIENEALVQYRAGRNAAEDADRSHSNGTSDYNADRDDYGESHFKSASRSSKEAVDRFEQAADLAREAGHSEAVEIARTSTRYAQEILVYFSEVATEAAQARQRGDTAEAEQHEERMKRINEDASERGENDRGIASTVEFREALDL